MRYQSPGKTVLVVLLILLVGLFSSSASADDETMASEKQVNPELLNLKIAEVEASTTLDEQTVKTLVDLYRRALTNLGRAQAELVSADEYADSGARAPSELERIRQDVAELRDSGTSEALDLPTTASRSELEKALSDEKAALTAVEARVSELRDQYALIVARPALARERLSVARTERDSALAEARAPAPIGEVASINEARRWHRETRAQRLTGEMRKLEQELLTHDVRLKLLEAKQEYASLNVERIRTRARTLEDIISQRRGAEAEQARLEAESTQQELEGQHPLVREMAAINVNLGERLTQRSLEIQNASDQRDATRQLLTQLSEDLDSTKNKMNIAGVSQALGQLLVNQRRSLPDAQSLNRQAQQRKRMGADVDLEQIEFSDQRRSLRDTDKYIDQLTSDLPVDEAEALYPELKPLLKSRLELLEKSIEQGGRYLSVLSEFDLIQRQYMDAVSAYRDFLDSTLLWVRSGSRVNMEAFLTIPDDVKRVFSVSGWKRLGSDFVTALWEKKFVGLFLVAALMLLFLRSYFLSQIEKSARYVGQISKDSFSQSVKALLFTLLPAVSLPLVLVLVGFAIKSSVGSAPFSVVWAETLMAVGVDLFIILSFIDACRDKGLLDVHCGWSQFAVHKLRSELHWYVIVFPIARLIGDSSYFLETSEKIGGLSIIGSLISAGALAVLIYRLFTPGGGILKDYLQKYPNGVLAHTRPVWFGAIVLVLPLLMVLWLAGYNYSGHVLAVSFMYSFWLILWLMVLQSLLARWLILGYQRLELQAAIDRRDAAREARRVAKETGLENKPADEPVFEVEEQQVSFAELNSDSRMLLKTVMGFVAVMWLWIIWAPIIPALGILDDITLWSKTSLINGEMAQIPVTLGDILLALLIAIATGVATKGMPALLELFLLQRSKMTTGGRYTATTLLRYSIVAIGALTVIGLLGISWSKAQWLVAALGVGIGFGLQEIVANFISGVMLLFERPIRVGDIVTVGDTSGVVTRMQIRATTIRDWDHRELLVPNKEFITGRLLNWSLSDEVLRVVIPVGIAYGSDVPLAMKLLKEAACEHENILNDPPATIIFDGFGDNSLNLTFRAYVPNSDHRMSTKSELNEAINRKFHEAGISIAYPQRDVHLDTTKPLEIRMQPVDD